MYRDKRRFRYTVLLALIGSVIGLVGAVGIAQAAHAQVNTPCISRATGGAGGSAIGGFATGANATGGPGGSATSGNVVCLQLGNTVNQTTNRGRCVTTVNGVAYTCGTEPVRTTIVDNPPPIFVNPTPVVVNPTPVVVTPTPVIDNGPQLLARPRSIALASTGSRTSTELGLAGWFLLFGGSLILLSQSRFLAVRGARL